ncbi:transporter substrate-binding domain-containing protein [Paraburkholderia bonniea]|uniref:transporter substrate-binding domain-containing protein n=1 Tax=Paraburkholderia bonniea TaxID=2152891 RepID=UPI002572538E|nr:transporter substrate-binding domain-containing protein [Paraburkholderia bonniea]WJF90277.1 transporter substrate-binding domain-containing protein [Paraburkholderia bonniea]WJF93592.1 transporter substrate-binding domain-containing protein [Paraburkholderia bonniea]
MGLLWLFVAVPALAAHEAAKAAPALDWFSEHAELVIGTSTQGRAPLETLSKKGTLEGLSPDLLRALLKHDEVHIRVKQYDSLTALVQAACSGEVDLITTVARTDARARCLDFSVPYLKDQAVLVGKISNEKFKNASNLDNARIGIYEGSNYEKIFEQRYPHAKIIKLRFGEAVDFLQSGKIDVYLGTGSVIDYQLARAQTPDITVLRDLPGSGVELHFAAPKKNAELIRALDQRLSHLSPDEQRSINARWLNNYYRRSSIPLPDTLLDLSPKEQEYLYSLPVLRLGFSADWVPLSYLDSNGRMSGVLSDYVDYLSRTLGLKFEREPINDWRNIGIAVAQGSIDIVAGVTPGDDRYGPMLLSRPLDAYPLAIVQRQSEPTHASLADLQHRRLAVKDGRIGDMPAEIVLPRAHIVTVNSEEEGLKMVADGKADAFAGNLVVLDSLIQQRYIGKLKIGTPLNRVQPLTFGVAPRFEELVPLINRALRAMPETEVRRIRNKWLDTRFDFGVAWSDIFIRLGPLALAILIVIAVLLRAHFINRREIAARIRAEKESSKQLKVLETLMDAVPYPVIYKDADARFLEVNRSYERTFNVTRADVLGKTTPELNILDVPYRKAIHEHGLRALITGLRHEAELEYFDGDKKRVGRYWFVPVRGAPGGPAIGVVGTHVDVTEIRESQEKVILSERRLREITARLPAIVFQACRAADGTLSFPFVSLNVIELFGVSAEDIMADADAAISVVDVNDQAALLQEVERSALALDRADVAFRVNNGTRSLWIQGSAMPRREPDGSVLWNGYWIDTTRDREREEALMQARDTAHNASLAKDKFMATMSHEIRTPMSGVLGLIEVLRPTLEDKKQIALADMMQDSASTLLAILDDILDYSKIEAGKMTINPTAIDLRQVVDQAVGLLSVKAYAKSLALNVSIDAKVAATCIGDGVRLRQIIFNLVGNAIKFTNRGSVNLRLLTADDQVNSPHIVLRIEDTGIGMTASDLEHIFDPFVQADSATNRKYDGTGLGLTICKQLTRLMDGTISIHSEVGFGTRVNILLTLPVIAGKYDIPLLNERRVHIQIADQALSSIVHDYVQALNMTTDQSDQAELIITDSDLVSSTTPTIYLERSVETVIFGFDETQPRVTISANPLSWQALKTACLHVFQGDRTRHSSATSVLNFVADPALAKRAGRILIAEDHPINRALIGHQMENLGYDFDVAEDGIEALALLERTHYAMLLTDCHMPRMDGYELVAEIRRREKVRGGRLITVGITASTGADDIQLALRAGMDECLIKPVSISSLEACLTRFLTPVVQAQTEATESVAATSATTINAAPDTSGTSSESTATPQVQPHLERIYEMFGGEKASAMPMLKLLRDTLRDDYAALREILANCTKPDPTELREWLHRNEGAAASMQLDILVDAITASRTALQSGDATAQKRANHALCELCVALLAQLDQELAG